MNFQTLHPVESSKSLLDKAFSSAREKASVKKLNKKKLLSSKKSLETLKIDIVKTVLVDRLQKIIRDFPNEADLPEFYQKLLRLTLDYVLFKKSLGAVNWTMQRVSALQKEYSSRLNRQGDMTQISLAIKEYYGRVSSVIKQINQNLVYLEKSRQVMRSYPDVKEMFTVCIYGFPNVGKSTLINKLTGSKAKVASYAFTTTSINSGFIKGEGYQIQVLDVPGTLARPDKMNQIELQAELVRTDLANLVVYIFDLSGSSTFTWEKQDELFQKIKSDKPILVYVSKLDLMDEETVDNIKKEFKHAFFNLEQLKEEIIKPAKDYQLDHPLKMTEKETEEDTDIERFE